MELDHSGFQTSTATVHAANLGDDKYILQVTPHTVSLMEGGKVYPTIWRICNIFCSAKDVTICRYIFSTTLVEHKVKVNLSSF